VAQVYLGFSVVGFSLAVVGVLLLWGVGWSTLVAGVVLFVVGGLGSSREVS
jgi:hypothetical protein